MKRTLLVITVSLVVAIIASVFISTRHTLDNVSACVQAPGCVEQDKQPVGKIVVRNHGFPAAYKQTTTFSPANNDEQSPEYAGYTVASAETRPANNIYIFINIVFWLALFYTAHSLFRLRKTGV